jgi:mRNA interferase YafQ
MKTLKLSGQFKKDLKKYKHRPEQLDALEKLLGMLQREETIPEDYKPHMLSGNYKGHMECHVQNDLLLICSDCA